MADINPRSIVSDASYPTDKATLQIGFDIESPESYEFYWINWVESDRSFLLGWHQDSDHDNLGSVHIQINNTQGPVDHCSAEFIDGHPMEVVEQRLNQLQPALESVDWNGDQPIGFK